MLHTQQKAESNITKSHNRS